MKKVIASSLLCLGIASTALSSQAYGIAPADKVQMMNLLRQGDCNGLKSLPLEYRVWLRQVTHFSYSPANQGEKIIQDFYHHAIVSGNPIVQCVQTLVSPQEMQQAQPAAQGQPQAQQAPQQGPLSDEQLVTVIQQGIKDPQTLCNTLKSRASPEQLTKIKGLTGFGRNPENATEQKIKDAFQNNFLETMNLMQCLNPVDQKAMFR